MNSWSSQIDEAIESISDNQAENIRSCSKTGDSQYGEQDRMTRSIVPFL